MISIKEKENTMRQESIINLLKLINFKIIKQFGPVWENPAG